MKSMEETKRLAPVVLHRVSLYQSHRVSIEYRYEVALVEVLKNAKTFSSIKKKKKKKKKTPFILFYHASTWV